MGVRDGWGLLREYVACSRSILALQIVAGAALFLSSLGVPASKHFLRGLAFGLITSLPINVLSWPILLVLTQALSWRWYRARVPSPSQKERWLFAGFAARRTAAFRAVKARGMVAVSGGRVVFVANASRQGFSIDLAEIVSARLETRRVWHLGLDHEVCLVRANAPEVRLSLFGAATLQRLVSRQ